LHSPTIDNVTNAFYDSSYLAGLEAIKFDIDWAESAIPANATLGPLTMKLSVDSLDQGYTEFSTAVSTFVTNVLSRIGASFSDIITKSNISQEILYQNQNPVFPIVFPYSSIRPA
jgi:hypothetical protein